MALRHPIVASTAVFSLVLTPSLAKAFIPVGPQNDVPINTVLQDWGWTECYVSTYATPFGTDASTAIEQCKGEYLMLAARRVGSDTFDVLAAAPATDVLTDTGAANNGLTVASNGSKWYYAPNWSWGFAGAGDLVNKNECDTSGPAERDRLCWHTFDWLGGFRSGDNMWLNDSSDWQRVILTYPAPAPLPIFGVATLFGYSRKLRKRVKVGSTFTTH
jgi:hypothetical protein